MSSDAAWIDLGIRHESQLVFGADGDLLGAWIRHTCTKHPEPYATYIPFVGPNAWTVVSREPLTLSPSLHLTTCGDHGLIQNGKWVPV